MATRKPMTPPDWASQRVEKVSSDGFSGDAWAVSADECARLLRLEHARAVRVVKKEMKECQLEMDNPATEYNRQVLRRDHDRLSRLLHKLKEGRT